MKVLKYLIFIIYFIFSFENCFLNPLLSGLFNTTESNDLTSLLGLAAVSQPGSVSIQQVSASSSTNTVNEQKTVTISVVFSEPVNVSGTPLLLLNNNATATYSSGSGSNTLVFTYIVASGEDISRLDLAGGDAFKLNGGSITSSSGNNAFINVNFVASSTGSILTESIVVDTVSPKISSVISNSSDRTYFLGESIEIEIVFSESVIVSGVPTLTLETGTNDAIINYTSGSGSNILVFTYIVSNPQVSSDLDYVDSNSLSLNGGSILDEAGNSAVITLPTPGSGSSLADYKSIIIDSTFPELNFSSSTFSVSESVGTSNLTVNLNFPIGANTTLDYAVTGGTATGSGTDYTLNSGSITIPAGSTSATIPFSVTNDVIDETDETFIVTLSNPTNSVLGSTLSQTVTILDDDVTPTISFDSTSSSGLEGVTTVNIPVSISAVSGQTVSVNYSITGGSATGGGTDYTLASGTLTYSPGTTSQNVVLSITDDAIDELDETVVITLASPTNAILGTNTSFTYTIQDNDLPPVVNFDSTSLSNSETVTSVNIPVSLSAVSGLTATVNYSVTGGSATGGGTDYTLNSGTLIYSPGVSTQNIVMSVVNDSIYEGTETIEITLSSPINITLGSNIVHTYSILNDEAIPTISFDSASSTGAESVTSVNLPVSLSGVSAFTTTVNYSVTGGTATGSGTDYTLASGTLTYSPGTTSQNIPITINNDSNTELNETIVITIASPSNANLGSITSHTYTITDDDPPTVAFDSASSSGAESTTSLNIPVSLSAAYGSTVTVNYSVTGGTASGSGTDYTLASGTLTFNPGTTSQNISLSVVSDSLDETDETLIVTLASPSNATLGTNTTYTYTITDDDNPPSVSFGAATSNGLESATTVNVSVNLSAPSGKAISVDYAVTGGTATGGGVDYTLSSGTLNFAAGETTHDITFSINNDSMDENDETIIITLSNQTNSTIGTNATHTYTITDDDDPPTISFAAGSGSVNESVGSFTVTANLSAVSGKDITLPFTVNGTSTAIGGGTDYSISSSPLTISAGSNSGDITITVNDDSLHEDNETIIINMGTPTNATLGATTSHTATITDNDSAPVISFTSGAAVNVSEGVGNYSLGFTLSAISGKNASITINTSNGTASSGSDYTAVSSQVVTIPAGQTTGTYNIAITDDTLYETNENFSVTMSSPVNTSFSVDTQVITIIENDIGISSVVTQDCDSNGKIDTYKITFTEPVLDSSFIPARWVVAGYSVTGTVSSCGAVADGANDSIIYLSFNEGGSYDTGAKPDLTTIAGGAISTAGGKVLEIIGSASIAESDGAKPVLISITPINGSSGVAVNSTVVANFSEDMNTSTFNTTNFTVHNGTSNVTGATSFTVANSVTYTPGALYTYNQAHTVTIANMADVNGIYMNDFNSSFTTASKNKITGSINSSTEIGVTITVNGTVYSDQNSAIGEFDTGYVVANGDSYALSITTQPDGKYCTFIDSPSAPTGGTFNGTTDIAVNVVCVNGYFTAGSILSNPPVPLDIHLNQGIVNNFIGDGSTPSTDGTGTGARVNFPHKVISDGTHYYFDDSGSQIRRFDSSNNVTTIAGTLTGSYEFADGTGTAARFAGTFDLTTDGTYIYVAEFNGKRIRRIRISTLVVDTLAGDTSTVEPSGTHLDGIGTAARFMEPHSLVVYKDYLFISDFSAHRIKRLDLRTKEVVTIAGNGGASSTDNSTGTSGSIFQPTYMTVLNDKLYIASDSACIRMIELTNTSYPLSTFAGVCDSVGSNDDVVSKAKFTSNIRGLATDGQDIYVSENTGYRVRRINMKKGIVTTITGFKGTVSNVNDVGANAGFVAPYGLFTDGRQIFIPDQHRIRRIKNNGLVANFPLIKNSLDYYGAHDGTLENSPTFTGTDRYNVADSAIVLNGSNQSISGSDSGFPSGASKRSVCAWVKPSAAPTETMYIFSYGTLSTDNFFGIGLIGDGSKISNILVSFYGSNDLNIYHQMPINTWNHICAVYKGSSNGSRLDLFINGKNISRKTYTFNTSLSGSFKIGANLNNTGYFPGIISDVRVYNRTLNEGEINELAQSYSSSNVDSSVSTTGTGLLAFFDFDNTDKLINDGALNFTLTNNSASLSKGQTGGSNGGYYFNGSNAYLSATTLKGLPSGNSPATLCSWVNPTSYPASGGTMTFTSFGGTGTGNAFQIGMKNNSGTQQIYLDFINSGIYINHTIPLNTWSFICGTYDGTNAYLYRDGIQLGSGTYTLTIPESASFSIGASHWSANHFNGKIDKTYLFNTTLSQFQVRMLSAQYEIGLVARFDFTGDANDVSGFGLDGTYNTATLTKDRFGNSNRAYDFTAGSVYIRTGAYFLPIADHPRTMCVWIRPVNIDSGFKLFLHYGIQNTGMASGFSFNGTGQINLNGYTSGYNVNITYPQQVWNHICGTVDGSNANIYFNGKLIGSTNSLAWNTGFSSSMNIGKGLGNSYHSGDIGEVTIYNSVLSDTAIQALSGYHPMQVSDFVPDQTSSVLKLHLQADSLSLNTDSTAISEWIDDSGSNLNPVSQVNNGAKPTYHSAIINNKPALYFDGTNQSIDSTNPFQTGGGTHIAFIVFKPVSISNSPLFVLSTNECASNGIGIFLNPTFSVKDCGNTFSTSLTGTLSINTNYLGVSSYNSSTYSVKLYEGSAVGSLNALTSYSPNISSDKINIGGAGSNYFNGYISEVIYLSSYLSTADQNIVKCYLSAKYGLTVGNICD
ncbi:MAG: Ig-like domain-containing protein [Leptospiraceae bacterium]|nr:Ig-like domain-containing protein [Leptospiraceae bacterium]